MSHVKSISTLNSFELANLSLSYKRLILPVSMIALLCVDTTRQSTLNALSDAYWAVSCYVAFTLVVYHSLKNRMSQDNHFFTHYHGSRSNQVIVASLLGALPGCGGAIVITSQFIAGKVGFGSVVAVLTATMGDAAFLLLASEPDTGVALIACGVVVGCFSGWLVNHFHHDDFLRPKAKNLTQRVQTCCQNAAVRKGKAETLNNKAINGQGLFWKATLIPSMLISIALSFQLDIEQLANLPSQSIHWFGAVLSVTMMLLWGVSHEVKSYQGIVSEDIKQPKASPIQQAAQDTHFVSAWVISTFLAFELLMLVSSLDLKLWLSDWGAYMPMMGVLLGLLPGCGPQLLITSLYLSGSVPMSAQIANAISNDGDALFPIIALAPKAALIASLYSAVPAMITGYGYYLLFEL